MKIMTKPKAKRLILLTLIIFFIFSNIFIPNKQSFEFKEKNQIQINQSGFWDLTGSLILIDDSDPNYNWTFTANYVWCSGSGSWTDPYVIENITINGQGSGNCIEIRNSDAYFIVRNCTLYNSGTSNNAGIKLDNVENGTIINNNCHSLISSFFNLKSIVSL